MLVVALAMPARCGGTLLSATAVTELMVRANPTPISRAGATNAPSRGLVTSSRAHSRQPTAISANPEDSSQDGATRCSSRETTGMSRKAGPCRSRKGSATRIGSWCCTGPNHMLVAKQAPRKASMPMTAAADDTLKARLRNSRRSKMGDSAPSSTTTNAARTIAPKASERMTGRVVQPDSGPSTAPYNTRMRPSAKVT